MNTQVPRPANQEIIELARLLPGPGERDLPAARRQILKEHLIREFSGASADGLPRAEPQTRPGARPQTWSRARPQTRLQARPVPARRSKRWLALAACATAAAAIAASVGIIALNQSSPERHPGPAAAQLLAKIAFAAAGQPTPHVRNSQ